MRQGRFQSRLADVALRYSESVSFDRRLYKYDIAGSIAHAAGLAAANIISNDEEVQIRDTLRQIEREIEAGRFRWDTSLEDLHMNIESALTGRIGSAGAKLHTGRSRNDQVAVDVRLCVKAEIANVQNGLRELQRSLLELADTHREVIMPGYTHLQRAQPIFFSHYLLGQVEAFARDHNRLSDCFKRTDVMPLGSAAIAGSTIVVDRELIAKKLGFAAVSQNSIDAVSDRDFVAEFLFCVGLLGIHLSRLSEDLLLWSTSEFGFVNFSEAYATGSSLMPQKKNSDMAELTRGKSGRLIGNLVGLLTMLKGLPTSYNRDLQEDKEALFDSVDTITAALAVFTPMLRELSVNEQRTREAASDPSLFATDVAEYLVQRGLPFRDAHRVVGSLVARASESGKPLDQVPLEEMRKLSPVFDHDVAQLFDPRESLRRRTAIGAPSPDNVAAQIARWRKLLAC